MHGICNELFYNYPQYYYPPTTVKATIYKGNATKKQIRMIIEKLYPEVNFKNEDESDAFAVGLTYLIKECNIKLGK